MIVITILAAAICFAGAVALSIMEYIAQKERMAKLDSRAEWVSRRRRF